MNNTIKWPERRSLQAEDDCLSFSRWCISQIIINVCTTIKAFAHWIRNFRVCFFTCKHFRHKFWTVCDGLKYIVRSNQYKLPHTMLCKMLTLCLKSKYLCQSTYQCHLNEQLILQLSLYCSLSADHVINCHTRVYWFTKQQFILEMCNRNWKIIKDKLHMTTYSILHIMTKAMT